MFMGSIPQGPKRNYVKTVLLAMLNDLHLIMQTQKIPTLTLTYSNIDNLIIEKRVVHFK